MAHHPARRRALATSPFRSAPEPLIAQYALADRVNHDAYGVGRVVGVEPHAVTVDFGTQKVRIVSPFHRLAPL